MEFTSRDLELIHLLTSALDLHPRTYRKRGGFGTWTNQVEIHDQALHSWLMGIGIMPQKTFRIGGIAIPDDHLGPLTRGLLDGDGTILAYVHAPNRRRYPNHLYARLTTRFYSASRQHLEWLSERLRSVFDVHGSIGVDERPTRTHPLYALEFAKWSSRQLLEILYRDPLSPRLERKHNEWLRFLRYEAEYPIRRSRQRR